MLKSHQNRPPTSTFSVWGKLQCSEWDNKNGRPKHTLNSSNSRIPVSVFFQYYIILQSKRIAESADIDGQCIDSASKRQLHTYTSEDCCRKQAGQPFKKCIQRMLSNGQNFGGQGNVTTFDPILSSNTKGIWLKSCLVAHNCSIDNI